MTKNVNEALTTLAKTLEGTSIDINIDDEHGVTIHWFGVAKIDCTPAIAAGVVDRLKWLEFNGMGDI